jgi:hypothetical protein
VTEAAQSVAARLTPGVHYRVDPRYHEIELPPEGEGLRSVEASKRVAELLTARGVSFSLLNALHHEAVAGIISGAGEQGRITIATNMAGAARTFCSPRPSGMPVACMSLRLNATNPSAWTGS